jgi:hypothetical protein
LLGRAPMTMILIKNNENKIKAKHTSGKEVVV